MSIKSWLKCVLTGLVGLSLIGMPAYADPPEGKGKHGKGKPESRHSGDGSHRDRDHDPDLGDIAAGALISAGIASSQARALAVEHRLTGYQSLPPGIRKNLARGKPLPPGIAKKAPDAFLRDLPVHPGYEWQVAGSDLILVAIATAVVADVLVGVFD